MSKAKPKTPALKNFYTEVKTTGPKKDKNFSKHMILPNSMIGIIGGTGSGKSNALMNFLSLKNEAFTEIIIFSGSTTDEPLYQLLKKQLPEVQLYNSINDVPLLSSFEDNKDEEKLIVFDDMINLPKKDLLRINDYFIAGRKYGFTVVVLAQNFVSIPKIVLRNLQYVILLKIPENYTVNRILKLYNRWDVPFDTLKSWYIKATSLPLNFFLIDMKSPEKTCSYRWNFTNCFPVP
jgi:ABC-type dipeptide/oligopeptide/nickel transport system ATPase component